MTRYHRRSSFLYVYTCVRWKIKVSYKIFSFFFVSSFYFFLSFFFSFFFLSMSASSKMSNVDDDSRFIARYFFLWILSQIHTHIKKKKRTHYIAQKEYMIVGSLRTTGSFYEYSHTRAKKKKKSNFLYTIHKVNVWSP